MRSSLVTLALLPVAAAPVAAKHHQSPAANLGVSAAGAHWKTAHDYLVRAAEQAPDSLYAFKPTADVRSLGQLFGHVANAEYMFCGMILGESVQRENVERTKTAKADLVAALKSSGEYCDRAYAMNDAAAAAMVNVFGTQRTKLYALTMNAIHDWEHYGNVVTYLRLKGLVPPSSQR